MECIAYINDLQIEIDMLKDIIQNTTCDKKMLSKKISEKEAIIIKCKENMSRLSNKSIEYKLYLNMLNGLTPSKSVEKVAEDNYLNNIKPYSTSNIWEYYKKLQKILKQE